jgi:hypothetical protein
VGEITSNDELKTIYIFPENDLLNINENVLLHIKNPKQDQKFMFIVFKNLNEYLTLTSSSNSNSSDYDEISIHENLESDDYYNENLLLPSTNFFKENEIKENINEKYTIINSNIISFKMNDKSEIENLKDNPIELKFKHLKTDIFESDEYLIDVKCSYWNYDEYVSTLLTKRFINKFLIFKELFWELVTRWMLSSTNKQNTYNM